MKNNAKIITISRMYGAGGGELGRMLQSALNIPLYNKQIVTEVSKRFGINENYLKMMDEIVNPFVEAKLLESLGEESRRVFDADNIFDVKTFYDLQKNTIRNLSDSGSCIFVGRMADVALSDRQDVISIFLYADKDFRIHRMMDKYHYSHYHAARLLKKTDKDRNAYCSYYTGREWNDLSNYDFSFNSEKVSLESIADFIVSKMAVKKYLKPGKGTTL